MSNKRKHDETDEDSKGDHANKKQKLNEHEEDEDKKIVEIWTKINNAFGSLEIREATEDEIDGWERDEKKYIEKDYPENLSGEGHKLLKINSEDFKFPSEYRTFLKYLGHLPKNKKKDCKVTNPKQRDRPCFNEFWDLFCGWEDAKDLVSEFNIGLIETEEYHPHWMPISADGSTFGVYYIQCDSKADDYGSIYRFISNSSDVNKVADSLSSFLHGIYDFYTDVLLLDDYDWSIDKYLMEKPKTRREKDIDTVLDENWKLVELETV